MYPSIKLINKAVWDRQTTLNFYSEGADGGHISGDENSGRNIIVETVDAIDVLKKYDKIDFLKIDIEGAERRVIPRIKDYLSIVDNIFIEYHSEVGQEQGLSEIFAALKANKFRVYIQSIGSSSQPFLARSIQAGFDLQLNIFGRRK